MCNLRLLIPFDVDQITRGGPIFTNSLRVWRFPDELELNGVGIQTHTHTKSVAPFRSDTPNQQNVQGKTQRVESLARRLSSK